MTSPPDFRGPATAAAAGSRSAPVPQSLPQLPLSTILLSPIHSLLRICDMSPRNLALACLLCLTGLALPPGMLTAPRSLLAQPGDETSNPGKPSVAEDSIQEAANSLARQVKEKLGGEGVKTIAVGKITPPSRKNSFGIGAGLQLSLSEALRKHGFEINNEEYDVELKGSTFEADLEQGGGREPLPVVRIRLQGATTRGDPRGTFEHVIHGVEAVPNHGGLTIAVPQDADDNLRSELILAARSQPQVTVQQAEVKPGAESQFAVQLLAVGPENQLRPILPNSVEGRAFALVPPGAEYVVRLVNHSDSEVAVSLTIDGLNVFQFSRIQPPPRYWLVPARGTLDVRGWFETEQNVKAFRQVDDFLKTARAGVDLSESEDVGLIHAAFCPASATPFKGTRGTALGRDVKINARVEPRYIGKPIAHISVFYERKAQ
jgi:hypothetical protein